MRNSQSFIWIDLFYWVCVLFNCSSWNCAMFPVLYWVGLYLYFMRPKHLLKDVKTVYRYVCVPNYNFFINCIYYFFSLHNIFFLLQLKPLFQHLSLWIFFILTNTQGLMVQWQACLIFFLIFSSYIQNTPSMHAPTIYSRPTYALSLISTLQRWCCGERIRQTDQQNLFLSLSVFQ